MESAPPEKKSDIAIVKAWIQDEVIGNLLCPPLVKLKAQHSDTEGSTDWVIFYDQIDIVSYRNLSPDSSELMGGVSKHYIGLMEQIKQRKAPLTGICILPDFETNRAYDTFIATLKGNIITSVLVSEQLQELIFSIQTLVNLSKGMKRTDIKNSINAVKSHKKTNPAVFEIEMRQSTTAILNGAFNLIYFYGQEVSDEDVSDISEIRGPVERYKYLTRAPLYMFQVVNPFHSLTEELTGTLNRPGLHRRNTQLAREEIALDEFNRRNEEYKK